MCDVWLQIEAHSRQLEREWEVQEINQKWHFYMARQICHTIHMHSPVKSHTKNINKFMPDPWEKNQKATKVENHWEVWEAWQKRQAAKKEKTNERRN